MSRTYVPVVAIVGRPNVGKSTLFNRLLRKRRAITLDTPGVTRDPISEETVWDGQRLRLVDTGGLGGESDIELASQVHEHTVRSAGGADLVVALLDARQGLSPLDRDTVELLGSLHVPVLYVANKADGPEQDEAAVEFCRLGIDVPLTVSAEHGIGLGELRDAILDKLARLREQGVLPQAGSEEAVADTTGEELRDDVCRVAIVGRPNVGKSSLLNAVAGRTLSLVDSTPGTTRDVIDTLVEVAGRRYLLLDTAGMRRPSKIERGIEKLSVGRSLDAVRRADVVLLLVEPDEGVTDQDARIARYAWDEGRAVVLVMNKSDHIAASTSHDSIREEMHRRYPTLAVVPMRFMSVKAGQGIVRCFRAVEEAYLAHRLEARTSDLNRVLAEATQRREPPVLSGGRVRFFYATQTATRPPTFTLFVNREAVPTDYTRFLERCFRENLPLEGTPLRLRLKRRPSHGPDRE